MNKTAKKHLKRNHPNRYDKSMDPNLPPSSEPTVLRIQNGFFDRFKNRYVFLVIPVLLIILAVLGFYIWQQKSKPQPVPVSENPDAEVVAQAGKEFIYKNDFNYRLDLSFPQQATASALNRETYDRVLDKLINDSIILQEAQKENMIEIPAEAFNNPDKNLYLRNALIASAEAKLTDKLVETISGEAISIWFNNASYPPPKMGVEAARKVALEKMESIHNDLRSNKITFQQAAGRILNDSSLAEIDPSYKANGATNFINKTRSQKIFNDPKAGQAAWSLKPGEISEVLTVNDFHFNGKEVKTYAALFKIVRVTKRSVGNFPDFSSWLDSQRSKYDIKKY